MTTKLFCIGNPLLDIAAEVDQVLIPRYENSRKCRGSGAE
jgi:sugar/nucleoside kinase (ribokinase family)